MMVQALAAQVANQPAQPIAMATPTIATPTTTVTTQQSMATIGSATPTKATPMFAIAQPSGQVGIN